MTGPGPVVPYELVYLPAAAPWCDDIPWVVIRDRETDEPLGIGYVRPGQLWSRVSQCQMPVFRAHTPGGNKASQVDYDTLDEAAGAVVGYWISQGCPRWAIRGSSAMPRKEQRDQEMAA